jgi:hypothetical protein
MKRLLACLAIASMVTASLIVFASAAGAIVLTAADLAADCNDDGSVVITVDTQVIGGSADITGADIIPGVPACLIDVQTSGVSLLVAGVNLRSKGGAGINFGQRSTGKTTITVWNSTIDAAPPGEPPGIVSIKSGCCGGFPSEGGAVVNIVGSTLRGRWVELGASLAAPGGRLNLATTSVTSIGDEFPAVPDIVVRVSNPGAGGRAAALLNTFSAPGGFEARTGTTGNTWFVGNNFAGVTGGVTLTTGPGGSCTSFLNGPGIVCT